jgi:mRNA-degrading endonuclease toxin of MazEF toxin-antitoxin module
MTTAERPYPTRVSLTFRGKHGQVALDQIRLLTVNVWSPESARRPPRQRAPFQPS